MSMFTKDFLKDSGISNEEDNHFYLHQDSSFNADPSHSNGFGLQGYGGAHSLNSLGQQRPIQQAPGNIPQQQLYGRPGASQVGGGPDSLHFMNSANAARPNPGFPSQGIIGGGGLPNSRPDAGVVGNGRINAAPGSETAFSSLGGRFPGHAVGGQLNALGGREEGENDDFPALPSSGGGLGSKHDGHLGGIGPSSLNATSNATIGRAPQLGPSSLYPAASTAAGGGGLGLGSSALGGFDNNSSNLPSSNPSLSGVTSANSASTSLLGNLGLGTVAPGPGLSKESRFAMAGLLETIRSQDKDSQVLALGTDLTTFGLNLNSIDTLYTSFVSPFVDAIPSDDPPYKTPQCYTMAHTPMLKADHWSKLTVETLFYIFYQMPRDILQAFAAQELYRRDWKYHGELRIWVKPHARPDLMQQTPQFVYFDAKAWEQKYLNPAQLRGNLLAGLLPEEEIRVKVPLPGPNPGGEP